MAHYAFIDNHNIVTQVIVGRDENDLSEGISDWEVYYSEKLGQRCLRTSYNTNSGSHTAGGQSYRGNYAGIGFVYNEVLDAFIPPQPYPSWILNEATYSWEAPIPQPEDDNFYLWNENKKDWEAIIDFPQNLVATDPEQA
jgi:hypothetical protein